MTKLLFIDLYVAFHKLWRLRALIRVAVTEQVLKIHPFLRYNSYSLAQNLVCSLFRIAVACIFSVLLFELALAALCLSQMYLLITEQSSSFLAVRGIALPIYHLIF